MGKGFRCTLRSGDAIKGAKERLPREEEDREGRRKKEKEEGRGDSIEDFLPAANNFNRERGEEVVIFQDKVISKQDLKNFQ